MMLLSEKYAAADFNAVIQYQREEGEAIGRVQGRIEERINTLIEFGKTPNECVVDLIKKFKLTEDEARAYVDKCSSLLV